MKTENTYPAECLSQPQREALLNQFKNEKLRALLSGEIKVYSKLCREWQPDDPHTATLSWIGPKGKKHVICSYKRIDKIRESRARLCNIHVRLAEIIGKWTFQEEGLLTHITFSNKLKKIENFAFCNSGLQEIEIPNSVKTIGMGAFEKCKKLTTVQLPSKLIKIEKNTFSGCENLSKMELPDTLQDIGENAFYNCKKLTLYCTKRTYERLKNNGILLQAGFCGKVHITDHHSDLPFVRRYVNSY